MTLSVVLITQDEEANLERTLRSLEPLVRDGAGEGVFAEIIVVDSGSTDRTVEIARRFGARVFVEEWKGFAAQKNSAIAKAAGDWVLLLDADEEVSPELAAEVAATLRVRQPSRLPGGFLLPRKNLFLGRWMRRGGFWPDRKLRLFRRGKGRVEDRAVHETVQVEGATATLKGALIHHAYPTLDLYLEHMRRYADLGGRMLAHQPRWLLWLRKWLNPPATWLYNYIVRRGFLDGREGALLHWHHARYVRWKYERALFHSGRRGDTEEGQSKS
jgi:glycosyltransferase involved in cell wall biosynthesis